MVHNKGKFKKISWTKKKEKSKKGKSRDVIPSASSST